MIDRMFFDMLDDLGVRVEYADLSGRARLGEYIHRRKLVRLHNDLGPREHPFVLGHETWHAINGDEPSMFPQFDEKMERRADEWAAMQLIDPARYSEVERDCIGHIPTMAFQLGVIDEALEVYISMLSRIGDTVYVQPRMGAGIWTERIEVVA